MTTPVIIGNATLLQGDCLAVLATLPNNSVHCCVTSPPYFGLRDYGHPDQIGLEPSPDEYVAKLVAVFSEVRRVLKEDGTCWINIGDSYARTGGWSSNDGLDGCARGESGRAKTNIQNGRNGQKRPVGLKEKDLIGIPWMLAFALRADGWYLRQDIIWAKPNPMPESVTDRCTKAHEYMFLLTKSARYWYDADAVKEANTWPDHNRFENKNVAARCVAQLTENMRLDAKQKTDRIGRNRRSVWSIASQSYDGAHFAVMPKKLVEPCILAGCPVGGTVLDPFNGSCTVGTVAVQQGCHYIGIELNTDYIALSANRLRDSQRQEDMFIPAPPQITQQQKIILGDD